jgi:hypothetical protein
MDDTTEIYRRERQQQPPEPGAQLEAQPQGELEQIRHLPFCKPRVSLSHYAISLLLLDPPTAISCRRPAAAVQSVLPTGPSKQPQIVVTSAGSSLTLYRPFMPTAFPAATPGRSTAFVLMPHARSHTRAHAHTHITHTRTPRTPRTPRTHQM